MASKYQTELNRLNKLSLQYYRDIKNKLRAQLRGNSQSGYLAPTWGPEGKSGSERGLYTGYGLTPSDAYVRRFIAQTGGNPYEMQLVELRDTAKKAKNDGADKKLLDEMAAKSKESAPEDLLKQLIESGQGAFDEAKQANLQRYNQGLQELQDLRSRNLERVKNFGQAAKQDLQERAAESLGNIQANLASRGMGGSTIGWLAQRVSSDLAREQQRLSEMVDDRSAQYDTRNTNDLVGFIERRNDIAPDFNSLAQLAQAYGSSGYEQQQSEQIPQGQSQQRYQPRQSTPQIPRLGGGGVYPSQLNAYQIPSMFGGGQQQGGYGNYGPQDIYAQQMQQQQSQQEWERRKMNGLQRLAAEDAARTQRREQRRPKYEAQQMLNQLSKVY
jgi:hypothetical protein